MKKKTIWILVIVFLIFPIAVGVISSFTSDDISDGQAMPVTSEISLECMDASDQDLTDIESGAISSKFIISNGKYVLEGNKLLESIQQIAPNASQDKVIAGFINNSQEVGVWTVGASGGGPINAINSTARKFTDWGSAANPGSSAARIRDLIDASFEAQVAAKCVNE